VGDEQLLYDMRFEVFTGVRMMFFWVLALCRLVSPEDGDILFLRKVGIY
jgi:hypothetical protein